VRLRGLLPVDPRAGEGGVSELVLANEGKRLLLLPEPKGKPWKGSQRSRKKGSNTLLRRISDIVDRWMVFFGV
jgi:hypothetical protein